MVTEHEQGAVGVPVTDPVEELIESPEGRPVADQVRVAPDWESVAEFVTGVMAEPVTADLLPGLVTVTVLATVQVKVVEAWRACRVRGGHGDRAGACRGGRPGDGTGRGVDREPGRQTGGREGHRVAPGRVVGSGDGQAADCRARRVGLGSRIRHRQDVDVPGEGDRPRGAGCSGSTTGAARAVGHAGVVRRLGHRATTTAPACAVLAGRAVVLTTVAPTGPGAATAASRRCGRFGPTVVGATGRTDAGGSSGRPPDPPPTLSPLVPPAAPTLLAPDPPVAPAPPVPPVLELPAQPCEPPPPPPPPATATRVPLALEPRKSPDAPPPAPPEAAPGPILPPTGPGRRCHRPGSRRHRWIHWPCRC